MVENRQTPTKLYDDYEAAKAEAMRLSIKERQTSYVLIAIAKVELPMPTFTLIGWEAPK
jgi:hypothetical protein